MDFIYEKKSSKNFSDTVEELKKSLGAQLFGVLWEMNFKHKLREKGFDFDSDFLVLEICSPAQAKQMLDYKIEVGYLMPCRMAVYEKDNKIWVGMQRPTQQIKIFDEAELEQTARGIEMQLMAAIDAAVL